MNRLLLVLFGIVLGMSLNLSMPRLSAQDPAPGQLQKLKKAADDEDEAKKPAGKVTRLGLEEACKRAYKYAAEVWDARIVRITAISDKPDESLLFIIEYSSNDITLYYGTKFLEKDKAIFISSSEVALLEEVLKRNK